MPKSYCKLESILEVLNWSECELSVALGSYRATMKISPKRLYIARRCWLEMTNPLNLAEELGNRPSTIVSACHKVLHTIEWLECQRQKYVMPFEEWWYVTDAFLMEGEKLERDFELIKPEDTVLPLNMPLVSKRGFVAPNADTRVANALWCAGVVTLSGVKKFCTDGNSLLSLSNVGEKSASRFCKLCRASLEMEGEACLCEKYYDTGMGLAKEGARAAMVKVSEVYGISLEELLKLVEDL